jgi:hypothetical protein
MAGLLQVSVLAVLVVFEVLAVPWLGGSSKHLGSDPNRQERIAKRQPQCKGV